MDSRDAEDTPQDDDHRTAYLFNPLSDEVVASSSRPSKRRKVSKKHEAVSPVPDDQSFFVALFNGAEKPAAVRLREKLFEASWEPIQVRIQRILREANQTTLDAVAAFVREAPQATSKLPAGFIITGPNVASQDLLFEQLADSLQDECQGRFVRIRSAEAANLKTLLKRIIRDATTRGSEDDEDQDLAVGKDGRKYLDYDLEALYAFVRPNESRRVILAFEDSEAFESGLLCDLIALLSSWKDRIPFTLLFGIATSVDLFQARLLKSACQQLYGGQFDVVQTSSVLDSVVKCSVAHAEVPLKVGPSLLRSLVERQREQVAGVQMFVSALKYAHMCHFYANPLSALLSREETEGGDLIQSEHLESVRSLPSFRTHVEALVNLRNVDRARSLLDDDAVLVKAIREQGRERQKWTTRRLQALHLITSSGLSSKGFADLYIDALADGIGMLPDQPDPTAAIKGMTPEEVMSLVQKLAAAVTTGDPALGLEPWFLESSGFVRHLSDTKRKVESLVKQARDEGNVLRSRQTAQSRVLRTTVVAQKVQLSQDSAALTDEDRAFTEVVDDLVEHVSAAITCKSAVSMFLNEIWLYDSRAPYKDVFVPRPGAVIARALSRPHDYLACSCCGGPDGGNVSATSVLYKLYLEAGSLINVADLWSAFFALVGQGDGDGGGSDDSGEGCDERTALVLFYRALADLRAMGFVKASRKKADHIAKLKWL